MPHGLRKKSILLPSVSAGAGHVRAAQALAAAGAARDDVHIDVPR
jgi:UDP-N-acetylglucosamine:LPS N-acetylglucosamine transferase